MSKAFVFSGGGQFVLPSLGVQQYLVENNILSNNDVVQGTSMGQIAQQILKTKMAKEQVIKMVEDFYDNADNVFTFWQLVLSTYNALNHYGLVNQINILFPYFGDKTFPDNLYIVSTDVNTLKENVWSSKSNVSLLDAVAQSMSLPVLFEPILINKDYNCDGGVLNNCPVSQIPNYNEYNVFVIGGTESADITNYRYNINSVTDYIEALLNGMLLYLNNSHFPQIKNLKILSTVQTAQNVVDFSNYERDIENGYISAKNFDWNV